MKRRDLLRHAGAAAPLALAGCISTGAPGSDPEETTDRDPTTGEPGTTTPDDASGFDPGSDEPFDSVAVGSRDGVLLPDQNRPHGVHVWNDADEARDLRTVVEDDDGEARLDRTWTAPADGYLALELLEPGSYELTVAVEGEAMDTLDVGVFDCNDSVTKVRVGVDDVSSFVLSTTMACRGPGIRSHALEAEEGTCDGGEAGSASVSFEDDAVAVDGALAVPNPCHGAELAGAEWDADAGTLTLVVGATEPDEGTACVECVGRVDYEARVAFEEGPPARVVVEHRAPGGTRTAGSGERGD